MAKQKWTQVGSVRKGQSGNLYIKIDPNLAQLTELKDAVDNQINILKDGGETKGINLQLEKPQVKLHRLLELGFIDDAEFQKRLERVPEYIRQEVTLPPQDK